MSDTPLPTFAYFADGPNPAPAPSATSDLAMSEEEMTPTNVRNFLAKRVKSPWFRPAEGTLKPAERLASLVVDQASSSTPQENA